MCSSSCTATAFLKFLNQQNYLSDEALLLSVYPLTVGGKLVCGRDVQDKFYEYLPPDRQKGVGYVRRGLSLIPSKSPEGSVVCEKRSQNFI